jgi:superfamily I DNA/RNA helicase
MSQILLGIKKAAIVRFAIRQNCFILPNMPTPDEIKAQQKAERKACLDAILASTASKKLIVAGAGTGKTHTFSELVKLRPGGTNLAMTFIKKLIADMESKLPDAEVKTFHAYCKKILHAQNGKVEIAPFLTKIIERDGELLENHLSGFTAKFQTLDEDAKEIEFHLNRGDYYDAVGFDDAVYRLYKMLQENPDVLPAFDQIVIDEYQDFHQLEVAFIDELSKKGDILIVGDDDQAVYDRRNASPTHLRNLHQNAEFEKFELPFCSRCPQVIVDATNKILQRAHGEGHLQGRIQKRYECYLADKEADSLKYPKIALANCTTGLVIGKYVESEIAKLEPEEIQESYDKDYPTVLVVGTKQYLKIVAGYFEKVGIPVDYSPSEEVGYGIVEAYEWLLRDIDSNLGWRILLELYFGEAEQRRIVKLSEQGKAIISLLPAGFVARHRQALDVVRTIRTGERQLAAYVAELHEILGDHFDLVALHFKPLEDQPEVEADKSKPRILLTSFKGCKGLSAGHVFIVGVHSGSIPKNNNVITDVEISEFIVALTRTRKRCHIVSNSWLIAPVDKKGVFVSKYKKSEFVSWIPNSLIENRGDLSAKKLK